MYWFFMRELDSLANVSPTKQNWLKALSIHRIFGSCRGSYETRLFHRAPLALAKSFTCVKFKYANLGSNGFLFICVHSFLHLFLSLALSIFLSFNPRSCMVCVRVCSLRKLNLQIQYALFVRRLGRYWRRARESVIQNFWTRFYIKTKIILCYVCASSSEIVFPLDSLVTFSWREQQYNSTKPIIKRQFSKTIMNRT